MNFENIGTGAQSDNNLHKFFLPRRLCTSLLEKLFQIPRHNPPCLYIGHSFIDRVLERTEFLGLGQEIGGRKLLHFLRQRFQDFHGFLDG